MKILIVIEHSPKQRFLVDLHTKELLNEVKGLIKSKRHSQAMVAALTKGRFEGEVAWRELSSVEAELILSKDAAHWDLTKR